MLGAKRRKTELAVGACLSKITPETTPDALYLQHQTDFETTTGSSWLRNSSNYTRL
jgi:hypothetical protein